jgi:hypothetical protein
MPKHICQKCDAPLAFGTKVIQLLQGPWNGAETPAYASLSAEWHEEPCFDNEFRLNPQERRYKCETCDSEIKFGEVVTFFVKGDETGSGFTVAERRGHEIYTINHHPRCPTN